MEKSKTPIIFSVSDFIAVLNQTLEYAYPTVEIEGEVGSFKVNQQKYVFFDLKDDGGSIGCFMTVWQLRQPIEDGMKVVISAVPKLTQWGKFSLTVKALRPSGEGSIKKSYQLLKDKLEAEGLFSPERKRPLPTVPQHIAVISSTQAAGYADFIKILADRWGGMKIDVANVQVQGASAPDQIIRAINYFNQLESLPEILIIIRGGGSADDLGAFNDEPLARAIAASRIPTVVGVGHEIDETLADFVADVRASTPSNAAQIIVPCRVDMIRAAHNQVNSLLPRIIRIIDQQKATIKDTLDNALASIDEAVEDKLRQIENYRNILSQLNPNTVLARGYALLRGTQRVGSIVEIETNRAILKAEVKNVESK